MSKNKQVFKVFRNAEGEWSEKPGDGFKEVELAVEKPSYKVKQEAERFRAARWADLVREKVMTRTQLDDFMVKEKYWDDDKQKKLEELQKIIRDAEEKIRKGGNKRADFDNATSLAKQSITARSEMMALLMKRQELDRNTAEALADDEHFNYLASACTVYNDSGERVFSSYTNFLEEDSAGNPVTRLAGVTLWKLLSNIDADNDFRKGWFEYDFLKKYGLVNDKLQFIRKDKKVVDFDGKLIDEMGRFVNEEGEFVNAKGERVDKDGKLLVEAAPFLDDDGNPIV